MIYAEAAYFDGNHCAHMVAREEYQREQRRAQKARQWRDRR